MSPKLQSNYLLLSFHEWRQDLQAQGVAAVHFPLLLRALVLLRDADEGREEAGVARDDDDLEGGEKIFLIVELDLELIKI